MTIDRDEFVTYIGLVREDIKGVKASVDAQADRIAEHATKIALLEQQARDAKDTKRETRRSFDGLVGGVLGAMVAGFFEWLTRK
jgi:hypothetical protein